MDNELYFLAISYAVKCGKDIKHYRGIFSRNSDKKFYFNVKRTKEFEFDSSLSGSTLKKYEGVVFYSKEHAKNAYNAIRGALKELAKGVPVKDADIMREEAIRTYPDDFGEPITYERTERVIGKVI